MKKMVNPYFLALMSFLALIFASNSLPAIDEEDSEEASTPASFEISGFISNKNILSTYTKQEAGDINRKNELHTNIKIKYGFEDFYLFLATNQYIIPLPINNEFRYSGSFHAGRNGTISGTFYEVNAREFYANLAFEKVRLRAGNQVYGWGTADVFNPTSYFNPQDLRELFFREEDELKQGIPSVSSMIFIGDYTLELVYVPVHVPLLVATENNFWEITYIEGPFPVFVTGSDGLPLSAKNSGYGGRLAGTVAGADLSLSAYHGPDKDPLMRPMRTVLVTGEPVSIMVVPEYHEVTSFGADVSMRFDKFVVQGEVSFSPDKTVCIDQPYRIGMTLPFTTEKTEAISYTTGFNYFIPLAGLIEGHGGTTVFTAEWTQTIYNGSGYMRPLVTDMITARLEDSFFEDKLKPSATVIWDTKNNGSAFSVKLAWDFQNGFSVNAEYWNIRGGNDSMLGYFREKDFISIGGRYEF